MSIVLNSRKYVFLFNVCLLLLEIQVSTVRSQDEGEDGGGEEVPEPTCQKSIISLVQGIITSSLNCLGGKLQLRSPFELTKRFYCIVKCSMMDLGVIGEDGLLDEVQALFYFQENVPEAIRETVIEQAQPCLAMASEFQPKQYYCQSYAPFTQCVVRSILQTFAPYALDCFSSPAVGFFFNFIDLMVPRANPSSPATNEVRRRNSERRLQFRRRNPNSGNSSTIMVTNSSLVTPQFLNSTSAYSKKARNRATTLTY